jgi:hypothetical protein
MSASTTRHRRFWALVCLVLFAASLLRYHVSYDPTDAVPHDPESLRLAYNLYETGRFANPFVPLDTGSSAHLAPAFPGFLAFLMHAFGEGSVGITSIKWAAVIVLSLQVALFPVFSSALGMGELNGGIAALIWILAKVGLAYPPDRQAVVMFGWESFYAAALVAIGVCAFRLYVEASPRDSIRLSVVLGLGLAGLALTTPTTGVIFIGYFVWIAWTDRAVLLRKSNLILVLLPVLFVTPWLVRNYRVFHQVIIIRDNFGLEFSVSNNDCAMFGIQQNLESGCYAASHPNANIEEARKVLADGEPRYNERKLREADAWIERHPSHFLKLSALRFVAFWLPPASGGPYSLLGRGRRLERLAIYIMTLLAVPGWFFLLGRDPKSAALCAICFMCFPLVHYVIQYEYRYRYPILWVTFLLGALPASTLVNHLFKSHVSTEFFET